jgi:CRP-like cAMP-binding protein
MTVAAHFPLHRMCQFGCLSDGEIARFVGLGGPIERYGRRAVISQEGTGDRSLFLLVDGWVAASELMRGGHRQITKFHLPGDVLNATSLAFDASVETLMSLTPVTVRRVKSADLGQLLAQSSMTATWMMLSAQAERAALMDRLTAVGRGDAAGRVAAALLDFRDRLSRLRPPTDLLDLPITQEEFGDYLGLTSVHINRTLRNLTEEGLIAREGVTIRLCDVEGLRRRSAIPLRRVSEQPDWLRRFAEQARAQHNPG